MSILYFSIISHPSIDFYHIWYSEHAALKRVNIIRFKLLSHMNEIFGES